uniref:Sugar phosphate transporter domain-containing protein n=1 Tax=Strombidinopsis acuminata TaxID=141414 RepID=A0A7S3X840_9SPIT
MLAAFFATAALTTTLIIFLYWSKGVRVICMVLSYLAALASIRLCVNAVVTQNFAFPLFLTMSHFVGSAAVAFICAHIWQAERNWPTGQQWVTFFLPVAAAHATSVSVSNIAIVHATISFVEVVSATTPLVTFGTVFLFGQPLRTVLLYPLAVIVMGTIIASEGQVAFSLLGFVLVFSGNILRSVKATMQQILLVKGPDGKAAFTPLEVTACTSLPCAVLMGVWSLLTEGLAPVRALAQANASLAGAFVLSIVVACFLNISVLFTIKELGAVGTQLVGQAKTLLVVLGSMAIFGDQVTPVEAGGFGLVMFGVWSYNYLDTGFKRAAAEKNEKGDLIKKAQGEVTQASCTSEPR